MKKYYFMVGIVTLFFTQRPVAIAQDTPFPRCGFARHYNPEQIQAIEAKITQQIETQKHSRVQEETIIVPLVVHIIHNNSSGEIGGTSSNSNISDAQIFSQIQVLNEDYRRKASTAGFNSSPVGADMNIEFMLYKITRHYSSKTEFNVLLESDRTELSLLGEIDKTPSDKFLNIFVANLAGNNLGYAEFPAVSGVAGLANSNQSKDKIDAAYIDYQFFGKEKGAVVSKAYGWGRTATHEVGHWLGLIHVWGDTFCGSDYCTDTPPAEDSNLTTDCTPVMSECIKGTKTTNMIENYMDFSADKCMNIFTLDQKNRTRAVLSLSPRRITMLQNSKILATSQNSSVNFSAKISPNPAKDIINLVLDFQGTKNITIVLNDVMGSNFFEKSYQNITAGSLYISTENIASGTYFLAIQTNDGSQTQKVLISH